MPKGRKRKATDAVAVAPRTLIYNPLRDRELLTAAAQALAASVIKEQRTLTAMSFCVEVLQSLGLAEIAIGQAERILISSARKAALGDGDSQLVAKPAPAAPVVVPHLGVVAAALQGFKGRTDAPPDFYQRLSKACDADELRSASLVHLEGFLRPAEARAVANSAFVFRASAPSGEWP